MIKSEYYHFVCFGSVAIMLATDNNSYPKVEWEIEKNGDKNRYTIYPESVKQYSNRFCDGIMITSVFRQPGLLHHACG